MFFIDLAQLLTIYLKIANIELFAFIWLEKSSILEISDKQLRTSVKPHSKVNVWIDIRGRY